MERYYNTLKRLPTELLLSTKTEMIDLDEIKRLRWMTRDTFLEMSQQPFAAANGIGQDHLQNFLDLQDAIIAKLLIKRLEDCGDKTFKICGLLQLLFTESTKLIDFFFTNPTAVPLETLKILVQNCPALFHCIALFKDFRKDLDFYPQDKLYYWNFIVLLTVKYPIQATLDLSKEVIEEIKLDEHLIPDNSEIQSIIKTIHKCFSHNAIESKKLIEKYKIK